MELDINDYKKIVAKYRSLLVTYYLHRLTVKAMSKKLNLNDNEAVTKAKWNRKMLFLTIIWLVFCLVCVAIYTQIFIKNSEIK